jgi:2-methylcitrate dehydratase PrpD
MDVHAEQQIAPARALADLVVGLRYEDIPPLVPELAKLLILDAFGCGLAATGYDFARATWRVRGHWRNDGPCAVICSAYRSATRHL